MARILILIAAHLSMAPRPQKEADALAAAGHDVTVRGVWFDPELAERDEMLASGRQWQFETILDIRPHRFSGRMRNLAARCKRKSAVISYRLLRHVEPDLLGHAVGYSFIRAMEDAADLTIVHSEGGLWIGGELLKIGRRVGVDFEDWFSEDLLPADRLNRPVKSLRVWEQELARNCRYCLAPSHHMAIALAEALDVPKPTVVYNAFPWREREALDGKRRDRQDASTISLHWFSQTIGPGRGLELLFRALPRVTSNVQIHLRGNLSSERQAWLHALIPPDWRGRVHVHPTVPAAELLSRIAEHDIGLALEPTAVLSTDLTVSNKLFQYMLGGLAIIATRTRGQAEVFAQAPEIGAMISPDSAEELAQAIDQFAGDTEALRHAQHASLEAARTQFCWEKQAEAVVAAADRALA